MKKFLLILLSVMSLTLTSCCGVYGQVYDDEYSYGITYSTVITYGTPYYIDGVLSYYLYDNIYYYPYIWNGHHYFRPFDHIQPHGFIFRPDMGHRPDFRFRGPDGNRPFDYGMRRDEGRGMFRGGQNRSDMRGIDRSSTRTTVRQGMQPQQGNRGSVVQRQPMGQNNFRQPTISRQQMPQGRGGIQIGGRGSIGSSRGGGAQMGGARGGRR